MVGPFKILEFPRTPCHWDSKYTHNLISYMFKYKFENKPVVHRQRRQVHFVFRLEGVVSGRYVQQGKGPERTANSEERQQRFCLFSLQKLAVEQFHVSIDL